MIGDATLLDVGDEENTGRTFTIHFALSRCLFGVDVVLVDDEFDLCAYLGPIAFHYWQWRNQKSPSRS